MNEKVFGTFYLVYYKIVYQKINLRDFNTTVNFPLQKISKVQM